MSEFGEPWTYTSCNGRYHASGENGMVMECGSEVEDTMMPSTEEVARIVACVNACAGIPTEELTALRDKITELQAIIEDYETRAWERSEKE